MQGGDAVLKVPGVLLHIGPRGAFVFIGDDSARIGGWCVRDLRVKVDVEHPVLVVANFGDFVVAQRIRVTIGADAPDMERAQFAIVVDGHDDSGEAAALRAQDLDDTALQQRGFAVGLDGEGLLVIENHRDGGLGILGCGGVRGSEHPLGRLGVPAQTQAVIGARATASEQKACGCASLAGPWCARVSCRTACARSFLLTSSKKPLSLSYSVAV